MPPHPDDHGPEGQVADLPHLARRRLMLTALAMGGAALSLWAVRGRVQTVTGPVPDGAVCVALPAETEGPFPADGTNMRDGQTVNIPTESGVIRDDIRTSIKGVSLARDGIFRDSSDPELAAQLLGLTGNPGSGCRATGRVGLSL